MIDHIKSLLDQDEIKALCKEKIKAIKLSETVGADLGFIDVVKKTKIYLPTLLKNKKTEIISFY